MTILIVLLFFKSLCLYLQNIVLYCYDKFLNPKQTVSSASTYPHRNRSIFLSKNTTNKLRSTEREQLMEKIRIRKKAAKQKI